MAASDALKDVVTEKGMVIIDKAAGQGLGVSRQKLEQALANPQDEGYRF